MQLRNGKIITETPDIETIKLEIQSRLNDFVENNSLYSTFTSHIQLMMNLFEYIDKVLPVIVQTHTEAWLVLLKGTRNKLDTFKDALICSENYEGDKWKIIMRMDDIRVNFTRAIESW